MTTLRPTAKITDAPYYADPSGSRDSTAAVQACVLDTASVEVPPGRYRITRAQTVKAGPQFTDHVGVLIPADGTPRRIWGHGRASTFLTEIDDPSQPELAKDAGQDNAVSWFFLEAGIRGAAFESVWFEGQAPSDLRFDQFRSNLAMACIGWSPRSGNTPAPEDVAIRQCGFARQFGFSANARTVARGVVVWDCDFVDCMNGLNLNADDAQYVMNRFLRSEGIEHTGTNAQILANRFRQFYYVAIAHGGDTSPRSAGHRSLNGRIIGNIADEGSHYAYQITVNTADTLFQGNTASRTRHHGLVVGGSGPRDIQPERVRVLGSTFVDCGGPNETAAMLIGGGARRVEVRGNTARYGEWPGYNQQFGLLVGDVEDVDIEDNELHGRHVGLKVEPVARRVFVGAGNRASRIEIAAGADVTQGAVR